MPLRGSNRSTHGRAHTARTCRRAPLNISAAHACSRPASGQIARQGQACAFAFEDAQGRQLSQQTLTLLAEAVATGLQQPLRLLYAESSAGSGSTALCASAGAPAGRPSILG